MTGQVEVLEEKLKEEFYYETAEDRGINSERSDRASQIASDGPCNEEESEFMLGVFSSDRYSTLDNERHTSCLTRLKENYKAVSEYFYHRSDVYKKCRESTEESEHISNIANNMISRIEEEKEYVRILKNDKPNLKINLEIQYSIKLKKVYVRKIEYFIQDVLYDVIETREVTADDGTTLLSPSGASIFVNGDSHSYEDFGTPVILEIAPFYCRRRMFKAGMSESNPYFPPEYLNVAHGNEVPFDAIDLKAISYKNGFVGLIGVFNDVLQLNETQYIGPLRFYPERDDSFNDTEFNLEDLPDSKNSWLLLKSDKNLRHKVNQWLSDPEKFKTPYKIKYKKLYDISSLLCKLNAEEFNKIKSETEENNAQIERYNISPDMTLDEKNELEDLFLKSMTEKLGRKKWDNSDYTRPRPEAYLESLVEFSKLSEQEKYGDSFEKAQISGEIEYKEELVFEDMRNNTQISNRDLGLGISQILPILIATNRQKNTTIVIEQPELHLHPAVQCEIADEFIRSYRENNNEFIIETHSEHLLLRVMKRLRHSSEGLLKKGDELYLTPDDVCLLYVDNNGDFTYLNELELDEDGTLLDPWPNGFFEEGLNERFT